MLTDTDGHDTAKLRHILRYIVSLKFFCDFFFNPLTYYQIYVILSCTFHLKNIHNTNNLYFTIICNNKKKNIKSSFNCQSKDQSGVLCKFHWKRRPCWLCAICANVYNTKVIGRNQSEEHIWWSLSLNVSWQSCDKCWKLLDSERQFSTILVDKVWGRLLTAVH